MSMRRKTITRNNDDNGNDITYRGKGYKNNVNVFVSMELVVNAKQIMNKYFYYDNYNDLLLMTN